MQPNESEKAVKQLKNIGGTIMGLGIIAVVLGAVVITFFMSTGINSLGMTILLSTSIIFGLVFTVLGYKIYKEHSKASKSKLIAVLIISIIILVSDFGSSSSSSSIYVPIVLAVSSIIGLNALKKISA